MMGAGLVSLQVAGAVARPDLKVTCVVASRQILSQNIDATCAELLRDHVERSANIEFLFGTSVTEIAKAKEATASASTPARSSRPTCSSPARASAPTSGSSTARRSPSTKASSSTTSCAPAVGNVWAAGDLAQGRNRVSGEVELVANWIDACEQGAVAGANMAGDALAFPGSVAENITTLFGAQVAAIGITKGRDSAGLREVTYLDERHGVYRRLLLRGEVMVGATLLRDVADAGVLRGAIVAGREAVAVRRGRGERPCEIRGARQGLGCELAPGCLSGGQPR